MARKVERPDSENYTKACEAYQSGKYREAMVLFAKEKNENPSNGYSYLWTASIWASSGEFAHALTDVNSALKLIPSKDKQYVGMSYNERARIYLSLGDTAKALSDCNKAISLQPENITFIYVRAELYADQGKYDQADADFDRIIEINDGSVLGYMGKARLLHQQGQRDEAIDMYGRVIKMAPRYAEGYTRRGFCYADKGDYEKAIDDIVTSLSLDYSDVTEYGLLIMSDSAYMDVVSKLKVQSMIESNNGKWDYYLGAVHERQGAYESAIDAYGTVLRGTWPNGYIASKMGDCYSEVGDYESALQYYNLALVMDTTFNIRLTTQKALTLGSLGQNQEAVDLLDQVLQAAPNYAYAYYQRAYIKFLGLGDEDGAIDDFTKAILLMPRYAYTYLTRGTLYLRKGEKELAAQDFEKTIEYDLKGELAEVSFYAYYYLGQKEKAIEVLNETLADADKGNYYDAACFYSIAGDTQTAIDYLRRSLEMGFNRFAHIARDCDLDNIRNTDEFKALIDKYKAKSDKEIELLRSRDPLLRQP